MTVHSFRASKGFTIVELIIVIVVIGILATVSIVAYNGVTQGARDKTVLSDIEAVSAELNRYSSKNNGMYGSAVVWYSPNGTNPNIAFTPSEGNVIDVVANDRLYCIRAYNAAGTKNTISNSLTKGSTGDACEALPPSVAAGGSGGQSLIGWWKLNGNAEDASGNGYNGSVNGPVPTTGAGGVANTAYLFSSSSTKQNIVAPLVFGTGPMTYSAWVKPTSYPSDKATIIQNYPQVANYMTLKSDGTLQSYRYGTVPEGYHSSISTVPLGQWSFTAVSWDGTNAKLYIDGVLAHTVAVSGAGQAAGGVVIGAETVARQFVGSIDDVRLYGQALSDDEILALYNAGAK